MRNKNIKFTKDIYMAQEKINKDMTFGELLRQFPKAGPILTGYGMHCIGCHIAVTETIEQGARAHGMDDGMITKMLQDLNLKAAN
jgi:hybrid cluster-associated redox disulfide protein